MHITLPSLVATTSSTEALIHALELLFEHSPVIVHTLAPRIHASEPFQSYTQLIDLTLSELSALSLETQAEFIQAHPRIGQTKALSTASAREQGNSVAPETLERLRILNERYERRYPGLRYITFVNGRSREQVAEEMEIRLGTEDHAEDVGGKAWKAELERAIQEIGLIAKSRLKAFGVE